MSQSVDDYVTGTEMCDSTGLFGENERKKFVIITVGKYFRWLQ